MSTEQSDFMKRLQAMRKGEEVQPNRPQMPSLKERLQAKSPTSPSNTSSSDTIRARIQSKFQKKEGSLTPTAAEQNAARMPAPPEPVHKPKTGAAPEEPVFRPNFEEAEVPQYSAAPEKEEGTQTWTPENGGLCPECSTFNLAHVAFCGHCETMLLRSEQEIVITTSYPIKEIHGLVHTFADKLKKLNIKTTEDMLRVGVNRRNRGTLVKHSGMSERSLLRLIHHADFCRIPSMTPESAAILELIGINTMADFLAEKPAVVYKKIQQAKIKLNQSGIMFLPTKNKVSLWFEEAQELPKITIQ